ncbi:helicase-related protein [Miniimonas arenae]|uniref:helicase-related protein n=1 Tax=Miniimonas arenae TaxID=676201 RepID=UPI0028B1E4B7|nr:helicase-related protein [Miniimonas arenae]
MTLALEASRMKMAGLFDPMLAVTTSKVDPLPHQIRAVYGEMLPRPGPLRFLLADDPGAGKTVMAGLYLKELFLRGDVSRCLIVAPGGLVDQWQEELAEKFDLGATILSRTLADDPAQGDPFRDQRLLIARMDQLSRDDEWLARLSRSEWDLVIVDEAHRMSATYSGGELTRTRRYGLGQLLGGITRHLLLMTATPHAGKDEDFQAFLALLDPDRFEGAYRRGVHREDYSGLMRRMVKEELLTFEGRRLFPERIATTVPYELTAAELTLYEHVTQYVREQMNLADRVAAEGDARRRTTVGFALTVLQRRLASSPAAIHRSLLRRADRLRERRRELSGLGGALEEIAYSAIADVAAPRIERLWEDPDEVAAQDAEELETQVLDAATAARTVGELDVELAVLDDLADLAARVRSSGTDRKWTELRDLVLQAGSRKLIVFTEHRDTLDYLAERITTLLGDEDAVVAIDGGTSRAERLAIRERFTADPTCRILVATDAAGEGLNLQAAHLMVNYDLPWNPNRLEQRFGRIHRIGQREVCRLWNLVAANTREGQVFERLLEKVEEQRRAYGGKVFDVLGDHAFGERPLRDLLLEAVRYGEDPAVRARLDQVVDASVASGLAELMRERALTTDEMSAAELAALRREMDDVRARRLQPHFVGRFFRVAFGYLGGSMHSRETGRYEITRVPPAVQGARVAPRYDRVTFEPPSPADHRRPEATLLAPGHPLFDRVLEETLRRTAPALERGAVLLDPEPGAQPQFLVALVEELHDGEHEIVSQRYSFVAIDGDGPRLAGPAPHLDLLAPESPSCTALLGAPIDAERLHQAAEELRAQEWCRGDVGCVAESWSRAHGLPAHRAEVEASIRREVSRTRGLVVARLRAQINYWYSEAVRLGEDQAAGRKVRLAPATARGRAEALEERLRRRIASLDRQETVVAATPRVVGALLVLPMRVVAAGGEDVPETSVDTTESDRRAVAAVLAAERALGRLPEEQAHSNPGFDVLSTRADGSTLRIEVKGRIRGAHDVHLSVQQILTGLNAGDDFVLALVELDPDGDESRDRVCYVYRPFDGMTLHALDSYRPLLWRPLWEKGGTPR